MVDLRHVLRLYSISRNPKRRDALDEPSVSMVKTFAGAKAQIGQAELKALLEESGGHFEFAIPRLFPGGATMHPQGTKVCGHRWAPFNFGRFLHRR